MASSRRFRDGVERISPVWLRDRPGAKVGYTVLWTLAATLDAAMDVLVQGLQAPWPGKGTQTALPLVGSSRGIIRNQDDTPEEYAERLLHWLEQWQRAGSAEAIGMAVHEYLHGRPRVRVVDRHGHWFEVAADGTTSTYDAPWDWDSVSHPERADYWSDLWVIVTSPQPGQWSRDFYWNYDDSWGDSQNGFGHDASPSEVDAVKGLLSQWKSAHTRIRCVIWSGEGDPVEPDGTWGAWGKGDAYRVPARPRYLRYWEP